MKYKDHFETEDYLYIIMEYYDNNLYKYLKDREIGMPINLIKKYLNS